MPIYKQSQAPIEERLADLVDCMTLAEKVRQLDLYAGAKELLDAHSDDTHAAPTSAFVPAKAEELFGSLGVGGIHDLYPTPAQANAIQEWVMAHIRLCGHIDLVWRKVCVLAFRYPTYGCGI